MDLQTLGKTILLLGAGLVLFGAVLWMGGRLGLGSLPGDIRLQGEGWSCFLPITTSILISVVLTLLLNLVWRMWNK